MPLFTSPLDWRGNTPNGSGNRGKPNIILPTYPKIALGSKFRIIGDSIFGRGHGGVSPGDGVVQGRNNGSFEQAFAEKPRYNFEAYPRDNQAEQAGYTTTWVDGGPGAVPGSGVDFHETLTARTLTMAPAIVAYSATINSRAIPNAAARIIAIYEQLIAAGIYVFAGIMAPAVQGASLADANYVANRPTINQAIRNWVSSKSPAQVLLLDWDVVMDPGQTGFCTRPELLLDDKVHVNPFGASVLGDYINSMIDLVAPSGLDLFDQRWAGLTNYMPNPTFIGSGGSRGGSWASGSVIPAGFRGFNATTTWTGCISTVEANPVTGGQSLVLPLIPKSTSVNEETFTLVPSGVDNNGSINNAALAGKYVVAAVEIEVDSSEFIGSPTLLCIDQVNGTTRYSRALDVDANNGGISKRRGKTQTFKLMTDPLLLDPASPGPRVQVVMRVNGLDAWNAQGTQQITIKPKRLALWDVGSPRARWNQ